MFHNPKFSCDRCGSGLMAFVMAGDHKTVVLFCLNCGTWYANIENDRVRRADGMNLSNPDHPVIKEPIEETASGEIILTELGCCVSFPPARWATEEEIINFGWGRHLSDQHANDWLPECRDWWSRRVRGLY